MGEGAGVRWGLRFCWIDRLRRLLVCVCSVFIWFGLVEGGLGISCWIDVVWNVRLVIGDR